MSTRLPGWYDRVVLRQPIATLIVIAALVLGGGWYAQDFRLDATTDSLTLENDADIDYYRSISARYGSNNFLIVTFTPHDDLFSYGVLRDLGHLRDALSSLPHVRGVTSILDVPLLQSPPVSIDDLSSGMRRLDEVGTDVALARRELLSSPLYEKLIISSDARTTAIRVDMVQDIEYRRLRDARDALREKTLTAELSAEEVTALKAANQHYQDYAQGALVREQENIAAVRAILADHQDMGTLHLGGVPMIIADSMDFIRHDLIEFGSAVILFLIVILATAFRKPRWIVLPLLTCLSACLLMLGILGFMNWHVTVVSTNIISFFLINLHALTMQINVR